MSHMNVRIHSPIHSFFGEAGGQHSVTMRERREIFRERKKISHLTLSENLASLSFARKVSWNIEGVEPGNQEGPGY